MPGRPPTDAQAFLPLAPADFQLLLILLEGPLHAYGITKAVEAQERGRVPLEIGSLYRILSRLDEWGLIEEDPGERPSPSGPKRKYFRMTALGRAVASAETARLRDVLAVAEARVALGEA